MRFVFCIGVHKVSVFLIVKVFRFVQCRRCVSLICRFDESRCFLYIDLMKVVDVFFFIYRFDESRNFSSLFRLTFFLFVFVYR